MTKAIIFDFSRVLLFPRDESYRGGLNARHDEFSRSEGYRFEDHFALNDELLRVAAELKDRYDLYIFTTGHIQNVPEVQEQIGSIFKRIISVEDIPFGKNDPRGYSHVLGELGLKPEEVLYIDDSSANTEVAGQAGISCIQFENNEQLLDSLKARDIQV